MVCVIARPLWFANTPSQWPCPVMFPSSFLPPPSVRFSLCSDASFFYIYTHTSYIYIPHHHPRRPVRQSHFLDTHQTSQQPRHAQLIVHQYLIPIVGFMTGALLSAVCCVACWMLRCLIHTHDASLDSSQPARGNHMQSTNLASAPAHAGLSDTVLDWRGFCC